MLNTLLIPQGFKTFVTNVGIKDATQDFVCIFSSIMCVACGVFTQNCFAGCSVLITKEHLKNNQAKALVIISKNANVATGLEGKIDAQEIIAKIAHELSIDATDVLIASTGVIGRRYPMDKIRLGISSLRSGLNTANFVEAAHGIMTTDSIPKYISVAVGDAVLVGIAKGVGMIEPNMATLLAFFFTDALIDKTVLDKIFRKVVSKTFNCLSIDTDTSTSDTAIILANGLAGSVDLDSFELALEEIATYLVRQIAKDGEGATKIIEVIVTSATDDVQAKMVAKSVVNSPLVKTAIHGADPNWGRVAMAIGKCEDARGINPDNTVIRFNGIEVYPRLADEKILYELEKSLHNDEIMIEIDLSIANGYARVWGCDLSADYIKINADYTT